MKDGFWRKVVQLITRLEGYPIVCTLVCVSNTVYDRYPVTKLRSLIMFDWN